MSPIPVEWYAVATSPQRDARGRLLAIAEVDSADVVRETYPLIRPSTRIPPPYHSPWTKDLVVPGDILEGGTMPSARWVASGHGLGQPGGHAVGGHDVEAGSRAQHDAGLLRRRRLREHVLEDEDLAGDIGVVRSAGQTGRHHGRCGGEERSGAVDDDVHVLERACDVIAVQVERPGGEAQVVGERADACAVAAGDHGRQTLGDCGPGDQITDVAVGTGRRAAGRGPCCAISLDDRIERTLPDTTSPP